MATFSASDFFARRYQDSLNEQAIESPVSKLNDVMNAANRKITEFQNKAIQDQAFLDQQKENSWVGQAGLELDSTLGTNLNRYASLVSGAGQQLGYLGSLPASVASEMAMQGITDAHVDAYNAYQQGRATPEQQQLLTTRTSIAGDPKQRAVALPDDPHAREAQLARESLQNLYKQRNQGKHREFVPVEQIGQANNLRELARDINTGFDFSSIVHQGNRVALDRGITEAWQAHGDKLQSDSLADKLEGAWGLLRDGGGAAAGNTDAVLEYVSQNIPQILMGMSGATGTAAMSVSNLGYAFDNYQKGLEKFQKENSGQLPGEEQRNEMARWALSTAAAEQVGDVVSLGGAKALQGAVGAFRKGAQEGTEAAARSALKSALRVPAAFAGGAGTEAFTEGYQTYAESKASLDEAKPEDIYKSAVIGGATGGTIRAGFVAPAQAVDMAAAARDAIAKASADTTAPQDSAAVAAKVDEAIKTGNVDALLDRNSESFAPDRAIAALAGHSQANPESRQANIEKADLALEELNKDVSVYRSDLKDAEDAATKLPELQAMLAQLPEDSPHRDLVNSMVTRYTDAVANKETNEKRLEALTPKLKAAEDSYKQLLGEEQAVPEATPEQVSSLVQQVKANQSPEAVSSAVDEIVTLSMANPASVNPTELAAMAEDMTLPLSELQRQNLRVVSKARLEANALRDMKGVKQEILQGSKDNDGIEQYQANMARALQANNSKYAERLLWGITAFAATHASKADALQEAWAMGDGTQIIRSKTGSWSVAQTALSKEALKLNNGLTIRPDSRKLVESVRAESSAINATAEQLQAAYDLKFKGRTNTGTPPQSPAQAPVANPAAAAPATPAPTQPSDFSALVALADTDAVYQSWSNVRDGSDRSVLRQQIADAAAMYAPLATPDNLVEVRKELQQSFKWFKAMSENDQLSFVQGLLPQPNNANPQPTSRPTPVSVPTNVQNVPQEGLGQATPPQNNQAPATPEAVPSPAANQGNAGGIAAKPAAPVEANGVTPANLQQLSDADLNDRLNAEMRNPGYQERQSFKDLDAEMSRREAQASKPAEPVQPTASPAQTSTRKIEVAKTSESAGTAPQQQVAEVVEEEATGEDSTPRENPETPAPAQDIQSTPTYDHTSNEGVIQGREMPSLKEGEKPNYLNTNIITHYLRQVAGKEGDASARPLVAVKDFLSNLLVLAPKFVPGGKLDEQGNQYKMLRRFARIANDWQQKFLDASKIKGEANDYKFFYNDLMQFLWKTDTATNTAVLDQNITTAMSYAGVAYLVESGSRTETTDEEGINRLLGRPDDTYVSEKETVEFGQGFSLQPILANRLGTMVTDVLGFKATADAPANILPNLRAQLGKHIINLLLQEGYLVQKNLTKEQLAALSSPMAKTLGAGEVLRMYAMTSDPAKLKQLQTLLKDASGSQGILDKVFGREEAVQFPTLTPVEKPRSKVAGSNARVPKSMQESLDTDNKTPNTVRMDMHQVMSSMTEDEFLDLLDPDEPPQQAGLLASYEARREGLRREYRNLQNFKESVLMKDGVLDTNTPFFLEHVMWLQGRVGIATQGINPQTSKIVRHAITRAQWTNTLDMNNAEHMQEFFHRVAESLGVKSDRFLDTTELDKETQARINDPVFQAGVQALVSLEKNPEQGSLTPEQHQALMLAVRAGGEGMHSLAGLMALAHWEVAKERGQAEFTSQLLNEVDGVTNGPMLSFILYGVADFAILNKGGFFQETDGYKQYHEYRGTEGNKDLYETITELVRSSIARLQETINDNGKPEVKAATVKAVEYFKPIDRNFAKEPTTKTIFGAAVFGTVKGMGSALVQDIYTKIEKLSLESDDKWASERGQIIKNINHLLIHGNTPVNGEFIEMPLIANNADLMKLQFTERQVKAIQAAFERSVGKGVSNALTSFFAQFKARTQHMNAAMNLAFHAYDAAYKALEQQMFDELMFDVSKGELPEGRIPAKVMKNEKGTRTLQPMHDLSAKQKQEIRNKLKPMEAALVTYMSSQESNVIAAMQSGIPLAKEATATQHAPMYKQEVRTVENGGAIYGVVPVQIEPGVKMPVLATHSVDSAASRGAMGNRQSNNQHDAHANGVLNMQDVAKALNESVFKVLANYSPMEQARNTLLRTIDGLGAVMSDPVIAKAVAPSLLKALEDLGAKKGKEHEAITSTDELAGAISLMQQMAWNADVVRLKTLLDTSFVDQYAFRGGNYEVTPEDKKFLQAELDKRLAQTDPGALAPQEIDAINHIATAMGWETMTLADGKEWAPKIPETMLRQEDMQEDMQEGDAGALSSNLGGLGTPYLEADPVVVDFFNENPTPTVGELTKALIGWLGMDGSTPFERLMKNMVIGLEKVLPEGTKIQYVMPTTPIASIPDAPGMASRAWYHAPTKTIYVLGEGFKEAALRPETLVHELLHAGLFAAIQSGLYPTKKGGNKAASQLVKELKELRAKAVERFGKSSDYAKYAAALGLNGVSEAVALHEFVTWGLSNEGFQKDILGALTVEGGSQNQNNSLVQKSLWQEFLGVVSKWWNAMAGKTVTTPTGMDVLLTNAAGLFARAEDIKAQGAKTKAMQSNTDPTTLSMANTSQAIDALSTEDVYEALGNVTGQPRITQAMDTQLRTVLGTIVGQLFGPAGAFKLKVERLMAVAAWTDAVQQGTTIFASELSASPLPATEQEQFVAQQVEATVKAAMEGGEGFTSMAYRELSKLYQQVYKTVKPQDFFAGDWAQATATEKETAQQEYAYVFGMGDKTNYLTRFAALGMANQKFRDILSRTQVKSTKDKKAESWDKRLIGWFNGVVQWLANQVNHTNDSMQANTKLDALVNRLVQIEKGRKEALQRQSKVSQWTEAANQRTSKWLASGQDKASNWAKSPFFQSNRRKMLKATATIAQVALSSRAGATMEAMSAVRDRMTDEKNGLLASLWREVLHPSELVKRLMLVTKKNEQDRMDMVQHTMSTLLEEFANKGSNLSTEDKAALTSVLLRSGAHHLLGQFDMAQLERMVSDPAAIDGAINQLAQTLPAKSAGDFVQAAHELGYYSATGKNVSDLLLFNAHNIVEHFAANPESDVQASLVPVVASLVSLYALKHTGSLDKQRVREVLRTENQRGAENNGVEFMLRMHKLQEEQSLSHLFNDNPTMMMHGFIPEITDPGAIMEIANETDGRRLVMQGYTRVAALEKDPRDTNGEPRSLYILKDAAPPSYVSGAISMENMKAKGTRIHSGFTFAGTQEGLDNQAATAAVMAASKIKRGKSLQQAQSFDPDKAAKGKLAPVLNEDGEIVNWRYLMEHRNKDTLLKRNNDFAHLLGTLAGQVVGKPANQEQNRKVIQALRDQYMAEYARDPHRYLEIGEKSSDPAMRELWMMLPKRTKMDIKEIWKGKSMMVRKDSVDILFGYHKLSMATPFQRANEERLQRAENGEPTNIRSLESINALQKVLVEAVEKALYMQARVAGLDETTAKQASQKAAVKVMRFEKGWQEIVAAAKSNIVIRSTLVLLGNEFSNYTLLAMHGVSLAEMRKNRYVATKGAMSYREDSGRLAQVNALLSTNQRSSESGTLLREKRILEDALAKNPVKGLIDAGLMPTIVDDVSLTEDPYSYKSRLTKAVDDRLERMHPLARKGMDELLMLENTRSYQFLSHATQLSDFVARYTLYQHLINKKNNPLSKDAALLRASNAFVNYDIPMHPWMQALDDFGITMFTKYFLRIQQEIHQLFKERPASVLGTALLSNFAGLDSTLLESSWMQKLGNNPLQTGPYKYWESLWSLPTVSAPLALVD